MINLKTETRIRLEKKNTILPPSTIYQRPTMVQLIHVH